MDSFASIAREKGSLCALSPDLFIRFQFINLLSIR